MQNEAITISKKGNFRPDIEGIRAIAILLVVLYHANVSGFTGGYIGVDVFFVLSGYLITGILIREYEKTGKIDLLEFYARRVRRLLPALYVVIAFTVVAGFLIFSPLEQINIAKTALAMVAYSSNIYFARSATDYLGDGAETNPLLHTWSLAVEEQFYFVYPIIFAFLLYFIKRKSSSSQKNIIISFFVLVLLLSFTLCVWLTEFRQPWAFFSMPTRAWEFAAGGLGILIPRFFSTNENSVKRLYSSEKFSMLTGLGGWLGLAALIFSAVTFNKTTNFPGFAAALPVIATILIICSGNQERKFTVGRFLSMKPFQEIGRLSYSWYLWHWVILIFADAFFQTTLPVNIKVVLLLVSLGIGELSYRLVEAPLRHNNFLSRRHINSIALAVFTTLIGLPLVGGWIYLAKYQSESPSQIAFTKAYTDIPVLYNNGCHLNFYETQAEGCSFGLENSEKIIVLFGDSHAAQWFPAIEEIAKKRNLRLIVFTKSACPALGAETFNENLGRRYTECKIWRNAVLKKIEILRPKVVILSAWANYDFTEEEWRNGIEGTLESLNKSSEIVINIKDTPYTGFNVPQCLSQSTWRKGYLPVYKDCSFESSKSMNEKVFQLQKSIGARFSNFRIIDMTNEICPNVLCKAEEKQIIIYRDAHHLTTTFIKSLVPVLDQHLKDYTGGDD